MLIVVKHFHITQNKRRIDFEINTKKNIFDLFNYTYYIFNFSYLL